jgi:hypothetical protein
MEHRERGENLKHFVRSMAENSLYTSNAPDKGTTHLYN